MRGLESEREMTIPSEEELKNAIANAVRNAVKNLFENSPGHHFYYIALITSGDVLAPSLTAWSKEALENELSKNEGIERLDIKWSYADSPFFPVGEQYFDAVRRLFESRPKLDPNDSEQWEDEFQFRMRAMEAAMAELDREGVFGSERARGGLVINVEVMPPDHTNTVRARRLNKDESLQEWLVEAAE